MSTAPTKRFIVTFRISCREIAWGYWKNKRVARLICILITIDKHSQNKCWTKIDFEVLKNFVRAYSFRIKKIWIQCKCELMRYFFLDNWNKTKWLFLFHLPLIFRLLFLYFFFLANKRISHTQNCALFLRKIYKPIARHSPFFFSSWTHAKWCFRGPFIITFITVYNVDQAFST